MREQHDCSESRKQAPDTGNHTYGKCTYSAQRRCKSSLSKQALCTTKRHIRRRRRARARSARSSTSQVRAVRSDRARLVCELALGRSAETFGTDGIPEGRAAVSRETRTEGLPINRSLRWVRVARSRDLGRTTVLRNTFKYVTLGNNTRQDLRRYRTETRQMCSAPTIPAGSTAFRCRFFRSPEVRCIGTP